MPALGKVKEKARSVTCAAQLKQFGLAWYFYSQDNDDYNLMYGGDWANGYFWFFKLGPYLGDEKFGTGQGDTKKGALKIMRCPSARGWTKKFPDDFRYGGANMETMSSIGKP